MFWATPKECSYNAYIIVKFLQSCILLKITSTTHWKNLTPFTLWKLYFQNIQFQSIPRVFLEHFHTTENISILWNWTKLWKLDFATFFYNISKLWKRSNSLFSCVRHICMKARLITEGQIQHGGRMRRANVYSDRAFGQFATVHNLKEREEKLHT